jgi:NADH dehydrogenase
MLVWSAGVHPVKFVQRLDDKKGAGGRLAVDGCLRVQGRRGRVFALGDAAIFPGAPLPPIAQKAEQEAKVRGIGDMCPVMCRVPSATLER